MASCFSNGWCDDDRCLKHLSLSSNKETIPRNMSVTNIGKDILMHLNDYAFKQQWDEVMHVEYSESSNEYTKTLEQVIHHESETDEDVEKEQISNVPVTQDTDESQETNVDIAFMNCSNKFMYT